MASAALSHLLLTSFQLNDERLLSMETGRPGSEFHLSHFTLVKSHNLSVCKMELMAPTTQDSDKDEIKQRLQKKTGNKCCKNKLPDEGIPNQPRTAGVNDRRLCLRADLECSFVECSNK